MHYSVTEVEFETLKTNLHKFSEEKCNPILVFKTKNKNSEINSPYFDYGNEVAVC